ncbi:MAG: hypothetical protein ABH831_02305 [Candidatus Nealsonbacteria bacterium]
MPKNQEKFNIEKLKNECPNFFKKISPELLEFVLSEEASSGITGICSENGVRDEEKIEKVAYQIILTLLKQSPKENLIITLKKDLGVSLETAKKISDKANELIFSQVISLEGSEPQLQGKEAIKEKTTKEITQGVSKSLKNDTYKEPIE